MKAFLACHAVSVNPIDLWFNPFNFNWSVTCWIHRWISHCTGSLWCNDDLNQLRSYFHIPLQTQVEAFLQFGLIECMHAIVRDNFMVRKDQLRATYSTNYLHFPNCHLSWQMMSAAWCTQPRGSWLNRPNSELPISSCLIPFWCKNYFAQCLQIWPLKKLGRW